MTQLVTLDDLNTLGRLFADERPGGASEFIGTASMTTLINLECAKHYDICVKSRPELYMIEQCITLAAPLACVCGKRIFVQMPTCPAFYLMGGIEIKWADDDLEPIPEIRAADSWRYERYAYTDRWTPKGYVFGESPVDGGSGFYIAPGLALGTTIRMRYIPPFPKLGVADCCGKIRESFNAVNGWDELVGLGVACKILMIRGKAQQLATVRADYQAAEERVRTMATERNAQEPRNVRDVYPEGGAAWWNRLPPP